MTAPPPDERPHGIIERVLGRVLGYMDTPWKAVVVIVLVILAGIGFGLWETRHAIVRGLFEGARPMTVKSDVSAELDDVIAHTKWVNLVVVWAVDLPYNTMRLIGARQRGGGAWTLDSHRLQAIEAGSNPDAIAKLSRGATVCVDPATQGSVVQHRFAADGFHWNCAIPVPPSHAEPLIGVLFLVWKERPDAVTEEAALAVAGDVAERMVMR